MHERIPILLSLSSPLHFFLLLCSGLVRNLLPRAAMNLQAPLLAPLWSASFSFR
jgi:hypothetical protein